ncbi:MAG: SRPBCC family protein [Ilumatobacteraceae bacterium]
MNTVSPTGPSTAAPQTISVSRVINATPERLYDLITDLPRMGEWSTENRGGRWMNGASGPAMHARFKGKNANGWRRWSTVAKVLIADRPREFVFQVTSRGFSIAKWGYVLEPVAGGTKVTETWYDNRSKLFAKATSVAVGVPNRAEFNRVGMEKTLEKLAVAAE